jgi:CubicO group peptidase (beta-lactamase class C family)
MTSNTPDNFWININPVEYGLNIDLLQEHLKLCKLSGADACFVAFRNLIISEWYSSEYRVPMCAMSSTKSITSLLIGMLIDSGKILDIHEPVFKFIPEWAEGIKRDVKIWHLLTNTSGLLRNVQNGVGDAWDKNSYVVTLSPSTKPGTVFSYSNEAVQLLSPIIEKASGESAHQYAKKYLFEPLDMQDTYLSLDTAGHTWTYSEMMTTPRDLARIGLMMLNRGKWQQKQIVTESWIHQSTSPSQSLNSKHGLLWWLHEPPKFFASLGYLDNNMYVFPNNDLIIIRMQYKKSNSSTVKYMPSAFSLFNKLLFEKDKLSK